MQAAALFQNSQQHRRAVVVEAVAAPARNVQRRRRDERLHLGKDRTRALHHTGHAGAGCPQRTAGEQHFRRVRHFAQTGIRHFKDTDLVGRAEAILRRAQQPVGCVRLALKIEHTVDHVLEHLRPCDDALLVDVADDENGHTAALAVLHQAHRAVLDLRDRAGRGGFVVREQGLDGVDDQNVRLEAVCGVQNLVQIGLAEEKQLVAVDPQTLGAELELTGALLAGDIEHALLLGDFLADLKQKGRLADARRAADEHQRAAHGAAAEHAIQLAHAGGEPAGLLGADLAQSHRAGCRSGARSGRGDLSAG